MTLTDALPSFKFKGGKRAVIDFLSVVLTESSKYYGGRE